MSGARTGCHILRFQKTVLCQLSNVKARTSRNNFVLYHVRYIVKKFRQKQKESFVLYHVRYIVTKFRQKQKESHKFLLMRARAHIVHVKESSKDWVGKVGNVTLFG